MKVEEILTTDNTAYEKPDKCSSVEMNGNISYDAVKGPRCNDYAHVFLDN